MAAATITAQPAVFVPHGNSTIKGREGAFTLTCGGQLTGVLGVGLSRRGERPLRASWRGPQQPEDERLKRA